MSGTPNKRIKLTRQGVAARMGRGARSLSAVRWTDLGGPMQGDVSADEARGYC